MYYIHRVYPDTMTSILQAFSLPYVLFELLLCVGYIAYAVIISFVHYRAGDGAVWILYMLLLLGIGNTGLHQVIRARYQHDLSAIYAYPVSLSILYLFIAFSFKKFYARGYRPELFYVLMIVAFTLSGISFTAGFIPSVLHVIYG